MILGSDFVKMVIVNMIMMRKRFLRRVFLLKKAIKSMMNMETSMTTLMTNILHKRKEMTLSKKTNKTTIP